MIGIFDSGSGGLTVMRAIREHLPSSDIIYFGDIANAPYGSKSHDELFGHTIDAIRFLKEHGATRIVSACNSVSAGLAVSLFDALSIAPIDLIEMVGPTVSAFKQSDARVLLAATPATVRSKIYRHGFNMIGKAIRQVPVPDLAGAIESGASDEEIERIIVNVFAEVPHAQYDVLVLACTHYPLVAAHFGRMLGDIEIIDPAESVAARVDRQWWPQEAGDGKTHFFITKESEPFRARVAHLFPAHEKSITVTPSVV